MGRVPALGTGLRRASRASSGAAAPPAGVAAPRRKAVAFVLKGYPRLSETFIAQEILGLERRGFDIRIVSLRFPTDTRVHPVHEEIRAPVTYLPEYLHHEPMRVLRGTAAALRRPGLWRTLGWWCKDFCRDPSANRLRRLGQALVLAAELDPDVAHLHAHFLHTPASVARYCSLLTGLPWTCSAHAKDIWTSPAWEKREKLAHCRWAVTCTALNRAHLASLHADPGRVSLVYHGLDLERFPASSQEPAAGDGTDAACEVRILSVGRAVDKKGYDDLLVALSLLPAELHWRFTHIGGGPLAAALKAQAERLGLGERIVWLGARTQQEVLAQYRAADLFALACRVSHDGDRDGLPNVLLEAQSQGLACVSTRASAIPELIEDGASGLLVPERDPAALAHALEALIRDPARRARFGQRGNECVRRRFSFEVTVEALVGKLDPCRAEAGGR